MRRDSQLRDMLAIVRRRAIVAEDRQSVGIREPPALRWIGRAILPWLVPLLIVLVAIKVWPPLTLWLPHLLIGR